MKLSSFISQINQNNTESPVNDKNQTLEQGLKRGLDVIAGKQTGQSITGEVLSKTGKEVIISLGGNQLLQAKLEGSMMAEPGQLLTFLIKNNSGSKIILSPLFENVNQNPNVTRALSEAGLPETEATVKMVHSMMEEGLPIDKQSLYQMNRAVMANPQTDILSLVQMSRLKLPITPENIQQFEAYKNLQHQLGEGLSSIVDSFSQTFSQVSGNNDLQAGMSFYTQLLEMLNGEQEKAVVQENVQGEGLPENEETLANQENTKTLLNQAKQDGGNSVQRLISDKDWKNLLNLLHESGMPDEAVQEFNNGKLSSREFIQKLVDYMKKNPETVAQEPFLKLLDSKQFKEILKNEMTNQWLMQPEEVAENNSVSKLYERLNSQMNKLTQILEQTVKGDTPLGRTVAQVSGNIDFMNQMNQLFTYVQIPLKLQQGNANGELFVYTNKKNLAREDGSVSALLHLDMENLGCVDVHVKMENKNVSTKFYMQDDSALDLIAENIDLLNSRLEKRGYSMNAEFVLNENETNVMEEILRQDKNTSVLPGYSFDARA